MIVPIPTVSATTTFFIYFYKLTLRKEEEGKKRERDQETWSAITRLHECSFMPYG